MVIIIMGVSGTGKSTIGTMLSQQLGIEFADADDFHPSSNIEKMKSGQPLTDADRLPWLQQLNDLLKVKESDGIVLACSALKESYRTILSEKLKKPPTWVYLAGSKELITERMKSRNHFMPPALLQSQLDTLEVPEVAIEVDVKQSPTEIVGIISAQLGLKKF